MTNSLVMPLVGNEWKQVFLAYGMFYCVAEIGGFAGPFFMGVLVDLTGIFMAGALFLASLCLAIAALTALLQHGTNTPIDR